MLLPLCRWFTSSDWCNMREYVLSVAFKLELQSVTHLSKSCRYCLNPRRSSMCLQPTVTCVITNCSPPVFFPCKCNHACLTRGWCWCAGTDAQSWQLENCPFCFNSKVPFLCIITSCEGWIILLTRQSKFGTNEECVMASKDWKQSIFFTVNNNNTVTLLVENKKCAMLHFNHESGQQDCPCSRTVVTLWSPTVLHRVSF